MTPGWAYISRGTPSTVYRGFCDVYSAILPRLTGVRDQELDVDLDRYFLQGLRDMKTFSDKESVDEQKTYVRISQSTILYAYFKINYLRLCHVKLSLAQHKRLQQPMPTRSHRRGLPRDGHDTGLQPPGQTAPPPSLPRGQPISLSQSADSTGNNYDVI